MVDAIKTPAGWPTILLGRAAAARPAGPRRGCPGRRLRGSSPCRARPRTDRDDRHDLRVGAARPGRCRLPGRREVADRGVDTRDPALRGGQRLRRGPRDGHGRVPPRARPVRGDRGCRHRRRDDRCQRGVHRGPGRGRPRRSGLEAAIGSAEEAGFAGEDVLGSGRRIELSVRPVQGAYMLGEETVLLKALEGKRGQPEQRPPHPAERGLYDQPTLVHNVQTLAAAAWIVRNGADAFRAIGTAEEPGTILVQLRTPAGDGIAEVPLGTPLQHRHRSRRQAAPGSVGQSCPGRWSVRRPAAARDPRHALHLRRTARGRSPHRLRIRRRRRRPGVRRRPGPAPHPLLCQRGVRQDDPLPDRHSPARGDRPIGSSTDARDPRT